MRSLQARLGLSLSVSLIALFILEWCVVSPALRSLTEDYVASHLERDTISVLAMVTFGTDGTPVIAMPRLNALYTRPFSGHYIQLRTAEGYLVRSRSLWDESFDFPTVNVGETSRLYRQGPKGQHLLISVSGFEKQGHDLVIAVAEDVTSSGKGLRQFEKRYVGVSLVILILLIAVQALIVRLSLVPLKRVRRDISRLERGEITQLQDSVPTEIRPLVHEMNRLLQIIEQRLHRSRHALGNLAHALKTPLTLVMQVAEREDIQTLPDARAKLMEHTAVLHQRLERELRRARLAGATLPRQQLLLAKEIPQLVRVLQSIYRERELDIAYCLAPHAIFVGDREDCLELLGNLLDNACQWAQHRIVVTVQETSQLILTLEDDGPGCPPEVFDHLAQRGVCIDESFPGHGLGLAIAKDIVEQYGGFLCFSRSRQLGGFQVQVTLPFGQTEA